MTSKSRTTSWKRSAIAWAALALLLAIAGCFNGGGFHNQGVVGGGGRFALVIEPGRTPIDGTHFLLDTATGDLWRLASNGPDSLQWLRLSTGPEDAVELQLPAVLGTLGEHSQP